MTDLSRPAIRHVVFDIGHVLIHYDPALAYEGLITDADARRAFLTEVCNHEWNLEQDRGRPWSEGEALLIKDHPGKEALIRAFRLNWRKMVPHAHPEAVAMMRTLIAGGHDVTLLTNFAADTFEEACTLYPFLNEPRGATVSGRIGLIKPEAAIYAHHEKTHALDGAATLFIDDNGANIDAARRFGWRTIHHEPGAPLAPALAAFGLPTDETTP